ncbi:hypothetical protein JCM11491_001795 [Sporobolomyces phaffii]
MPLLSQVYCPLETSSLERVVYVFACPRALCRKRDGSVRAFRAHRIWKDAPDEKARIQAEQREARPQPVAIDLGGLVFGSGSVASPSSSKNPFAATSSNPFAPAAPATTNPFAAVPSQLNPFAPPPPPAPPAKSPASTPAAHSTEQVTSTWPAAGPSYPAQYITTSYEPASPKLSSKQLPPLASLSLDSSELDANGADDDGDDDRRPRREGKGSGGRTKKGSGGGKGRADGSGTKPGAASSAPAGAGEGYEVQRVKGVDQVFLKFQERVSREGAQVIRYEHDSQPLAFSASSAAYQTLFPRAANTTGGGDGELGTFSPVRAPTCRSCRARCVFEYQLMPNLVAHLNRLAARTKGTSPYGDDDDTVGNRDRGKVQEEGLDWATVWVFTCGAECVGDTTREKESWIEEHVLIEWEE